MQVFTLTRECVHSPGGRLFPVHLEGHLYQEFPVRTRNIQSFLCFHSLKTVSNVFNIADITWIRKIPIFSRIITCLLPPHVCHWFPYKHWLFTNSMWTSSMICWSLGLWKVPDWFWSAQYSGKHDPSDIHVTGNTQIGIIQPLWLPQPGSVQFTTYIQAVSSNTLQDKSINQSINQNDHEDKSENIWRSRFIHL